VESVGEELNWRVRPGRARPADSVVVIVITALQFPILAWLFSFPVAVMLLVPIGLYLAGPLWIAVTYRIDAEGITRKTPFGQSTHAWQTLGRYRVDRAKRTAWILRHGRGTARFLPPLLLLWEDREGREFRVRLEHALNEHLGFRLAHD
jgi:hypothetical protein